MLNSFEHEISTTHKAKTVGRWSIVLPRSNDHVYIGLFVNIQIKTSGSHIQQSNYYSSTTTSK